MTPPETLDPVADHPDDAAALPTDAAATPPEVETESVPEPLPAPRELREYQTDAVAAVEAEWESGLQRTAVVLPTGSGKAVSDDALVPTPRGYRRHGDLIPGDEVFGPDGEPLEITHIWPQGVIPTYLLHFSDGTVSPPVSGNHVWTVHDGDTWSSPSTDVLRRLLSSAAPPVLRLPRSKPVQFPAKSITVPDSEGLSPQSVSEVFFTADTHTRYSLLYALGRPYAVPRDASEVGGSAHLEGVPSDTSAVIQRLAWSLGFSAPITGDGSIEVSIADRQIVKITEAGEHSCQCITVAAEDGLYLLGHEHLVTHNSTVIASVAARARAEGKRVVMLAHRGELLGQMADTVAAVDPGGEKVGVVMARQNEVEHDIVAASFQTLARSPERVAALGRRDVILVDECHHGTAPTYLRVLQLLGLDVDPEADLSSARESDVYRYPSRPETVACGFTATMSRADKTKLGNLWSSIAYERDLVWAIENGFLIKPTGRTVEIPELDRLASLRTVAGDYVQSDLDDVMRSSVDTTVDAILTHASGRALIVFAASVQHADELADALNSVGIKAAAVVGSHTREERAVAYEAYRSGELDALVTVQVLTEGADFPRCDTVVLARPTRSLVLYCYDDETEILTPDGWVLGTELDTKSQVAAYDLDTEEITWSVPQAYVNRPLEPGEQMFEIDSPTVSMRVTDGHDIVYSPRDSRTWRKKKAADLARLRSGYRIPVAGYQDAPGVPLTDAEIAALGDALARGDSDVLHLLDGADSVQLAALLQAMRVTPRQATDDAAFHVSGLTREVADGLQSLGARLGWSAVVVPSGGDRFTASFRRERSHLIDTPPTESPVRAGEHVWCVQVPTGAVVTRRRGKVAISGNSQIVGRAVRPYTDPATGHTKTHALVLDLTGVARDQKLRTLTDLWGEAETREYTADGEEIIAPPEPAPQAPSREREGRADLVDVDLFGDQPVLILRSRNGVLYVPGGMKSGRQSFVLWPPNPSEAERVYLLHITPEGGLEVWRDGNGTPVHGTWEQALEVACKTALAAQSYINPSARWRRGALRPSDAQRNLAGSLGIPITPAMSKAEVSDATTSHFLDRTLERHLGTINQLGLT